MQESKKESRWERVWDNYVIQALLELLFLVLASTLPFWLGSVFMVWADSTIGIGQAFPTTFQRGEFFLTVIGFVIPCFWILARDPKGYGPIGRRFILMISCILIAFFAVGGFALIKAQGMNPQSKINISLMVYWSQWLLFSAVLVRFFVLCSNYTRQKTDPALEIAKESQNFADAFKNKVQRG